MARGFAAALDRQSRRLVDGDDVVVPVEHTGPQGVRVGGADRRPVRARNRRLVAERRDADLLALHQPVASLGAPPVDAHLPGAQQLLEPAVADFGKIPFEPAVESQLGLSRIDPSMFDL